MADVDKVAEALACVYSGATIAEAQALLDALEDRGRWCSDCGWGDHLTERCPLSACLNCGAHVEDIDVEGIGAFKKDGTEIVWCGAACFRETVTSARTAIGEMSRWITTGGNR